jgi:hypothetical protein
VKTYRWAAVGAVVALLSPGCTTATPAPATPTTAPTGCRYAVRRDVLPAWARSGFSGPSPSGIPFVLGTGGKILGVVFGYPLTAPPPPDTARANKILWVASPQAGTATPDDLRIDARLAGSAEVVHREVPGGPGPSIIDLPRAGCWHLTLTWSNHADTLDLRYDPAA